MANIAQRLIDKFKARFGRTPKIQATIPGTRVVAPPGMKFGPGTGRKAGTRGTGKGGAGDM